MKTKNTNRNVRLAMTLSVAFALLTSSSFSASVRGVSADRGPIATPPSPDSSGMALANGRDALGASNLLGMGIGDAVGVARWIDGDAMDWLGADDGDALRMASAARGLAFGPSPMGLGVNARNGIVPSAGTRLSSWSRDGGGAFAGFGGVAGLGAGSGSQARPGDGDQELRQGGRDPIITDRQPLISNDEPTLTPVTPVEVPAPVTLGLLGVGLIGLMVRARLGRLHHSL